MRHFLFVSVVLGLCSLAAPARAQITGLGDQAATPVPGAGHNYIGILNETVDPASGKLSVAIKLPVPPGRKLTLPFSINYFSLGNCLQANPHLDTVASACTNFGPFNDGSWLLSVPQIGRFGASQTVTRQGDGSTTCLATTGYTFSDSAGTQHNLQLANIYNYFHGSIESEACTASHFINAPTGGDSVVSAALIGPSSGQFTNTDPGVDDGFPTAVDPDGTRYVVYMPGDQGWCYYALNVSNFGLMGLSDRNGNSVSLAAPINACGQSGGAGTLTETDTIGRTAISASWPSLTGTTATGTVAVAGIANPYTLNWTKVSYSGYTFSTAAENGSAPPVCSAPAGAVAAADNLEVTSIDLPNGQNYTLSYDPTYGTIGQIKYPTGGYVSYSWALNPLSADVIFFGTTASGVAECMYNYDSLAVSQRNVSFDGVNVALQQNFSYSTTWDPTYTWTWDKKQTIVTTHDVVRGTSFQTTYTYAPVGLASAVDSVVMQAQTAVESSIQYNDTNGSLLKTVTKGWLDQFRMACELVTLGSAGPVAGSFYTYGAGGQVTDRKEYDYGQITSATACHNAATAPSGITPAREMLTTYQPFPTPTGFAGPVILDRPCKVVVKDSTGAVAAETDYYYDGGTTLCGGSPTVGNATKTAKKCLQAAPACASGDNVATYAYDSNGQVTSMTDANSNITTYSYTDVYASCGGNAPPTSPSDAYLTQITYPVTNGVNHIEGFCYDYTTGLLLSSTDENGQTTTYTYADSLNRLTKVVYPDGGQTTYTYNDSSYNSTTHTPNITTSKLISAGQNLTSVAAVDGVGQNVLTELTTDPDGIDYTATTYDGLGRKKTVTNAYRTTSDPTYGLTTYYYDALGRSTIIVPPDGTLPTGTTCPSNDVCTTYSANTTTVTDEASHSRQSTTDGLGRLTKLIESPGGLGFESDYQYDALDDLICAVQKGTDTTPFSNCASASATWRPRAFTYNSLAQLTSAKNPESGLICYGTISGTTCQQNGYDANGNLITKTDARGILTTSTYDVLNRLTLNTYSDSTNPAGYVYDADTSYTGFGVNAVGRLAYYTDGRTFGYHFTYDIMGRPTKVWECIVATPALPGTPCPLVTYTYDLAGDETSIGNPEGTTFTQTFDGAVRVSSLTSSWSDAQHPAALATPDASLGYYPAGGIRKLLLGNGLTETVAYNDRVQPCRMNVNSTAGYYTHCTDAVPGGNVLDLTYGYNLGTADNGNVATWSATGQQTFNRSYVYDAANRVSTMSAPGDTCSGLSWTYDAWGNRTDQTVTGGSCGTFHDTVTTANQFTGSPYTYDASGNMTHDASHSYFYDAENRLIQVDGTLGTCSTATACYLYDFATGQRIQKTVGAATTSYMRDTAGNAISEWGPGCGSSCWTTIYAYLGSRLLAEYWNSTTYFFHQDHLGSTRLLTGYPTATPPVECDDYLPFGESLSCGATGTTTHKFTGKERDAETASAPGLLNGLDNFEARYYSSSLGRFISPDPLIITPERKIDPQELNLYAYVRNNPLRLVDPTGETLQLSGDVGADTAALCSIVGSGNCDRISINEQDNTVSFNTSGLDLSSNEGATLVNQLVTSSNVYGLAVSDTANTAGGQEKLTGDPISNLDSGPDDRYGNGKPATAQPPNGVSDQVTINPNTAHFIDSEGRSVLLSSLVFHELAEAFAKIDGGKQYADSQSTNVVNGATVQIGAPQQGAHNEAVQREFKLRAQRPNLQDSGRAGDQLIKDPHN